MATNREHRSEGIWCAVGGFSFGLAGFESSSPDIAAAAARCRSEELPAWVRAGVRLPDRPGPVRWLWCYRRRVCAYAHHSPREPRGGAGGRRLCSAIARRVREQ